MSLGVSSSGTEAIDLSYPENQDIESGLNYFLNNSDYNKRYFATFYRDSGH